MDIKLEIELFTVDYLKFIFSDFWIFIGFCIVLLLLQGLIRVYYEKLIRTLGMIRSKYKKNEKVQELKDKYLNVNKSKPE